MNNIIPHKWEVKKFDEIFDVVTDYVANGSFASLRENVSYKDDEDYAILVRLQDYSNKFQKNFVYVDEHAYNFLSKSKLNPNDLVICNVGAAGIIFKVPDLKKPMTLGPNSILVRTNESSDYMYYYIQSSIGQQKLKDITTTTAQPKFNKTDFKSIKCILPPLKEQQKIAEILSSVDAAIEKTEQVIAKTEELKKGLMQQLLTKGIGHTEFKKTEFGEIPIKWSIENLGNVLTLLKDGTHNPPKAQDKGIPMLSAENIFNHRVNFGIREKFISLEDYNNMHKKYEIETNDILLTIVGTIGRTAIVDKGCKFTVQRSVAILRANESILVSKFLEYLLNTDMIRKQLKLRSNASAQAGIYLGELGKVRLLIPSIEEQISIIKILENIDEKLKCEEKGLEKLELMKRGLMQQLLTGQVRVKID